jgi:hypothetical protein
VGVNVADPVVTREAMEWGAGFALWACRNTARDGGHRLADNDQQASANLVLRIIDEAKGWLGHTALLRRLKNRFKSRDIKDILTVLAEGDMIEIKESERAEGGQRGPLPVFYRATRR